MLKKKLNEFFVDGFNLGFSLVLVALFCLLFTDEKSLIGAILFASVLLVLIGLIGKIFTADKLKKAKSLEKAIVIAFSTLKPGETYVAPKNKLVLVRNTVPMNMRNGSVEIYVLSIDRICNNKIITAFWSEDKGVTFSTEGNLPVSHWDDKW